jgi:dGTPase
MSPDMLEPTEALRKFLFDNFYLTPMVNREADKSKRIVIELYEYFLDHPEQMDLDMFGLKSHHDLQQVVCDYIACMTDDMALETYIQAFVPKRIA